jgi:hypothetical protein
MVHDVLTINGGARGTLAGAVLLLLGFFFLAGIIRALRCECGRRRFSHMQETGIIVTRIWVRSPREAAQRCVSALPLGNQLPVSESEAVSLAAFCVGR